MAKQFDTFCDSCGKGVDWKDATYDDQTGKVACASCQKKAQKEKRHSTHEYRYENIGKRPR